jgi:riboflavin kinase/FMN adenylyltransferase
VPEELLLPARGVYVVRARWKGRWFDGVANIGTSPTFGERALRLEVHLFDFKGGLYEETLEVAFYDRLREEKEFPSVEELRDQIRRDVQRAREVLRSLPEEDRAEQD